MKDINTHGNNDDPFAYATGVGNRYTQKEFYGIMIVNIRGHQIGPLQDTDNTWHTRNIELDESKAGVINVQLGIGFTPSVGMITINIPIGRITFFIPLMPIPYSTGHGPTGHIF
jgi:hypothetical protein